VRGIGQDGAVTILNSSVFVRGQENNAKNRIGLKYSLNDERHKVFLYD